MIISLPFIKEIVLTTAAIKVMSFDNAFNNTYWNGSVMTYGDGDGQLLMF
jgi:Zn-dependent metalloprotease